MRRTLFASLLSAATLCLGTQASHAHGSHAHTHAHTHHDPKIYAGYFDDAQIAARPLGDWAGEWQSVYPYLQEGTLDPVMAQKAKGGEKTAAEYRAYYEVGYRTDMARITITPEGKVTFHHTDGTQLQGTYASDGYEVLTYAKGNRGVRFVFKKVEGDARAPAFMQFSDHRIAPSKSDHYHLYWGDDRAALLQEVTHWPTYYPADLSGAAIAAEMLAH